MTSPINLALAQVDLAVGDVAGNVVKIIEYAERARDELRADLVVFPELSVCGYPPEDLLFHSGLRYDVENALVRLREQVRDIALLIGFPEYADGHIYNSCAVFFNGRILAHYRKQLLPNYSVFDEERYFRAGRDAAVFKLNGIRLGLNICEDVWQDAPALKARSAGAEVLIAINGSPYGRGSQRERE
ncbi:MAG: nitrilase-related carbon-nitrogen hydrolase, partial [Woeseiaceae bacterium]|nr:nitrilase-related carbon-nitrogen hydrolase [Woeseiaceae bacterium]